MTNTNIVPFVGVGNFMLLSSFNTVKTQLELAKCGYTTEIWPNKGCTPQVEWKIIHCDNHLNLFFAKDKLFKIYVDGEFPGKLPNGIYVGMSMKEATLIDTSLRFDDWNEDWSSDEGYWLEDDLDTDSVLSISIFIKELLDDDEFDKYQW